MIAPYGEGIVIDIGTGDGRFVYQSARRNPGKFYIGIDANPRPLEKVSERIHRKSTKGGLANVLFVQAAVEELPEELNGVANELHIQFPWGSLLRAVATGDHEVLRNLRRICADGAGLEVIIGLEPNRDRAEIARLGLPGISKDYVETQLVPKYRASGFEIVETGIVSPSSWREIESSWAKRLRGNDERVLVYFRARTNRYL